MQRGFRSVLADRRGVAQSLGAIPLGHADLAGSLARLCLLAAGLHLFALEGGVAIMRGQASGFEPGLAPDSFAERRELAEMRRALDGAALESQLLRGRIVVD